MKVKLPIGLGASLSGSYQNNGDIYKLTTFSFKK